MNPPWNADAPKVLLFMAAGLRLGIVIAEIDRILGECVVVPVPFAHPAMLGLTHAAPLNLLVPVFDLRGLRQAMPMTTRSMLRASTALLLTERGPIGLRLDALFGTAHEILPWDGADASPAASLVAARDDPRTHDAFGEIAVAGGAPFLFFNPEGFSALLGLS